jgi:hypothetical protein
MGMENCLRKAKPFLSLIIFFLLLLPLLPIETANAQVESDELVNVRLYFRTIDIEHTMRTTPGNATRYFVNNRIFNLTLTKAIYVEGDQMNNLQVQFWYRAWVAGLPLPIPNANLTITIQSGSGELSASYRDELPASTGALVTWDIPITPTEPKQKFIPIGEVLSVTFETEIPAGYTGQVIIEYNNATGTNRDSHLWLRCNPIRLEVMTDKDAYEPNLPDELCEIESTIIIESAFGVDDIRGINVSFIEVSSGIELNTTSINPTVGTIEIKWHYGTELINPGLHQVNVTLTTMQNVDFYNSTVFEFKRYGIYAIPPTQRWGEVLPGGEITYTAEFLNSGGASSNFKISITYIYDASSAENWDISLTHNGNTIESGSLTGNITPNTIYDITCTVRGEGPSGKPSPEASCDVIVKLVSEGDKTAIASITLTTTIVREHGIKLLWLETETKTLTKEIIANQEEYETIEFKVINNGSKEGSFILKIVPEKIEGWDIKLKYGDDYYTEININITDPYPAYKIVSLCVKAIGRENITTSVEIEGTSVEAPEIPGKYDKLAINLTKIFGIILTIDPKSRDANVKTSSYLAIFSIEIENCDNITKLVNLEVVDPKGWAHLSPLTVTLEQLAKATVTLTVNVPQGAEAGVYQFVVIAEVLEPLYTANITAIVNVTPYYDIRVWCDERKQTGKPGEILTYTLNIENKGNTEDKVVIGLIGPEWITADVTVVSIKPGEVKSITLTVKIPEHPEVKHGDTKKVTVNVQSVGDLLIEVDTTIEIKIVKEWWQILAEVLPLLISFLVLFIAVIVVFLVIRKKRKV